MGQSPVGRSEKADSLVFVNPGWPGSLSAAHPFLIQQCNSRCADSEGPPAAELWGLKPRVGLAWPGLVVGGWASVRLLMGTDLGPVTLLPVAAWKGSTGHSGNKLEAARGIPAFNLSDFQVIHSVPSWVVFLGSKNTCWLNLLLRSRYHPFIASRSCWGILLTRSRACFRAV